MGNLFEHRPKSLRIGHNVTIIERLPQCGLSRYTSSNYVQNERTVMNAGHRCLVFCLSFLSVAGTHAQDDTAALSEQGKALYFERVSCWVCHGDMAEGRVGPSLQHGPTPMDIQEQLDSNPQMGFIVVELNPDADDLVALAAYLGSLDGESVASDEIAGWRAQLEAMAAARGPAA